MAVLPESPTWNAIQPDTLSESEGRPFLFVDGEGAQTSDGGHAYMMLAAYSERTGPRVLRNADNRPLSTRQCLEFLLDLSTELRAANDPHTFVGFGLGYDFDMIFRDLPETIADLFRRAELRHWRTERGEPKFVGWYGYRFRQIGSQLYLSDAIYGINGSLSGRTKANRRTAILWDVWKFFQGSFVKALRDWQVLPPAELDAMAAMKGKRSSFAIADYADETTRSEIEHYCLAECRAGVALVAKLTGTCRSLGFPLARYDGAGSLAAAMLKAWRIDEYMEPVPEPMREPVSCAYFGGRFEISRHGRVRERVSQDDINSAYPFQIAQLPCLVHGSWEHAARPGLNIMRNGLYRVRWDIPAPCQWGPFPHRRKLGTITYPRTGSGWYWGTEIEAARKLYPDATIETSEGWELHRECEHRPFDRVPDVYAERQRLGKSEAGIVLKLGLNSLYGKMAQSIGQPRWANYIWAGMVTAGCRAMILDAIRLAGPEHVLMIATDAVVTDCRLPLPSSPDKRLGEWDHSEAANGVLIVQPGITISYDETETPSYKSRGLGKREFAAHAGAVEEAWQSLGVLGLFTIQTHRFLGLRTALARHSYPERCRWVDVDERLSFYPGAKRVIPACELTAFAHGAASRSIAPDGTGEPSLPYVRLMAGMEGYDAAAFLDEQPAMESEMLEWTARLG